MIAIRKAGMLVRPKSFVNWKCQMMSYAVHMWLHPVTLCLSFGHNTRYIINPTSDVQLEIKWYLKYDGAVCTRTVTQRPTLLLTSVCCHYTRLHDITLSNDALLIRSINSNKNGCRVVHCGKKVKTRDYPFDRYSCSVVELSVIAEPIMTHRS